MKKLSIIALLSFAGIAHAEENDLYAFKDMGRQFAGDICREGTKVFNTLPDDVRFLFNDEIIENKDLQELFQEEKLPSRYLNV